MRSRITSFLSLMMAFVCVGLYAQESRDIDNWRKQDQRGLHEFEAPKTENPEFDGVKVRIGGASAVQFQALDHENSGSVELMSLQNNFNLPTANMDIDVVLAKGVRMHLRTYLSSRHHPEPYVKGGFIQVDALDFVAPGFMENFMKHATLKIGHMENNYGDAHFRRSDNAQGLFNPFVGNLIMDSFTTEVGAELYYRSNGFISMIGFSNGKLNQSVVENTNDGASFLAKIGYDNTFDSGLRFRLTGSMYNTGSVNSNYLYTADRAGSRYYFVMEDTNASASSPFRSGRYDPGFKNRITALMFNPFVQYGGFEFFGTLELAKGRTNAETENRKATQYAAEAIYRFGPTDNFYLGARYNHVENEEASGANIDINRTSLAAGWFLTKNVVAKAEYVNQKYNGFTGKLEDGKFNGFTVEAVISF